MSPHPTRFLLQVVRASRRTVKISEIGVSAHQLQVLCAKFLTSMVRNLAVRSLILVALCIAAFPSFGQLLIVQTSDMHSHYERLPSFLRSVRIQIENFKKEFPKGDVLFLWGGDNTGAKSVSFFDKGWLGIEVMERMAHRFESVSLVGNHDAFDWSGMSRGNETFLVQMRALTKAGVKVLAANSVPTADLAPFIRSYYDVRTNSLSRPLRIHGFTLNRFVKSSNMDISGDQFKVFQSIGEMGDEAVIQSVRKAVRSYPHGLSILAFHDNQLEVKKYLAAVMSSVRLRNHEVIAAFAAHDHRVYRGHNGKTLLIDSGSDYAYSTVQVSRKGRIFRDRFYPLAEQEKLISEFRGELSEEFDWIEEMAVSVEDYLQKISTQLDLVLAEADQPFPETKLHMKDGPTKLGGLVAQTLKAWGDAFLANRSDLEPAPVIGLLNSSGYRKDDPTPQLLRVRDFIDMHAMSLPARLVKMSWADARKMFGSLKARRAKDQVYSPQISHNLAVSESDLLYLEGGQELTLQSDQFVYVALDPWTALNGYQIPEFEEIGLSSEVIDERLFREVLLEYGPEVFGRRVNPFDVTTFSHEVKQIRRPQYYLKDSSVCEGLLRKRKQRS